MKRTFFIKGFIYTIFWCTLIISVILYMMMQNFQEIGGLVYVLLLSIIFYQASWVKVILKKDYVVFVNGFIRERVFYDDILGLRMKEYKPKFIRGITPVIIVQSKHNKTFILYFRRFKEKDIAIIVKTLKQNNERIRLCHNITKLIKKKDSRLMKKIKKDEKVTIIFILCSIIVVIGLILFIHFLR